MELVYMFSGQGAQYAGMGKALYDNYKEAKAVFDEADSVLGYSIKDICFSDEEKLKNTEYAQPAILTMSMACHEVLKEKGIKAQMAAGLSLGEYTALTAAGAFKFADAVALVQKRGKFMAEAVPDGKGVMYAIIGLDRELVDSICKEVRDSGAGFVISANYNCPGQVAIAGYKEPAKEAAALAKEKGAKLVVKLKVSGPFHTELLNSARDLLLPELEKVNISDMEIPVYTNVTAKPIEKKEDIVPTLAKQIVSPVRWEDTIANMIKDGADTFVELGPGKALNGFVKRCAKGINVMNVEDLDSLDNTLKKLESVI